MHPELIKAHLRMAGSSAADVARALSVAQVTVHDVIRGNKKSRRVAERISSVTGLPLEKLWPGQYPKAPNSSAAPARQAA